MPQADTWRLTDGGLDNHGLRVSGVQAVSSGVDRLHSKHIVCSSGQAVAHKPADSEGENCHQALLTKYLRNQWWELQERGFICFAQIR